MVTADRATTYIIDGGPGKEILRGEGGADTLTDSFFGLEDGKSDIFVLDVGRGADRIVGFSQSSEADVGDRFWLLKDQFKG